MWEGKVQMGAMRPVKEIGSILFLLWLLLINIFYYTQFRKLGISHLPWLPQLWRRVPRHGILLKAA
jgi:hypothetical protein